MKIAFCVVVKDDSEVKDLAKLFETVLPYVDSVHVTANGEETAEIEALMRSTREKNPKLLVDYSYLEWKSNFSEQRNFNFSRVPKGTDYIFWADTDDELIGGEYLRPIAELGKKNGKDILFFVYWYGCQFDGEPSQKTFKHVDIEHYRERLIRPGTIQWKGRCHETPVPVNGQRDSYSKIPYKEDETPIAVMHKATLGDAESKIGRNRDLLELQLKEEREAGEGDPRTMLYLMKIYAEVGDKETLEKCIKMGEEYLTKSGWDEERANANDLMAICSSKLGRDNDAIMYSHRAINEYPFEPLHYIRLSMSYFAVGRYRESKHWLMIAGGLDTDSKTAGVKNIQEMKVLFSQMLLKISYNVDQNIDQAVEAAKILYKVQPFEENHENLLYLMDMKDLKDASDHTLKLLDYLESIEDDKSTRDVVNSLPIAISEQPFVIKHRQRVTIPRVWKDNEICYFANFGQKHFEKWDGRSLQSGLGGSETAVIELSQLWADMGYKVTVYGDPQYMGEYKGVTYLPWYYFNKGDKFNIMILWRNASIAQYIKSKKTILDLHDVISPIDYSYETMTAIDKIMVKSKYHLGLFGDLVNNYPDKFCVISNGIQT